MKILKIYLLLLALSFANWTFPNIGLAQQKNLMLAKVYNSEIDVTQYLVSEKLDGVRARWNGKQLISKNGKVFAAPDWFIENFPNVVLDGELWFARNSYEKTISIVSKKTPHQEWQNISLWVFDLPESKKNFAKRFAEMQKIITKSKAKHLKLVEQYQVADEAELMQNLENVIELGGEGLMLHKKTALYQKGSRSQDLLKLKKYQDAEATVIGYKDGKGKYAGLTGSLKVRDDDGKVFYVGSGLSDALRKNPPALNSTITFRYQGFTKNGIPRFPVFLRIRYKE